MSSNTDSKRISRRDILRGAAVGVIGAGAVAATGRTAHAGVNSKYSNNMASVRTSFNARPIVPDVHASAYVHPLASVIGAVTVGRRVMVSPCASVRGDEGSPIPAPGGGFRRDRRGEMILSKLDEPTLQKIALNTGGSYVRSVTGDVDLEKIYSQGIKATLEDQELGSKRRQRWEERFQWVLGLALLCLCLEPLISERQRRGGLSNG